MRFILDRTNDSDVHSKKWIVGYGLLFWLVTRIVAACILVGCVAVYNSLGLNPEAMTKFTGNPETARSIGPVVYVLLTVMLVAPLVEETIFRLGLSFRKWQVALGVSTIPLYVMWNHMGSLTILSGAIYVAGAVSVFCLICLLTSKEFWQEGKRLYCRPVIWLSAIAFGPVHLIAFSNYSINLLPYMLCVILVPFFAGCAITYYRVNLGFWWGFALHVFNNIPALVIMFM